MVTDFVNLDGVRRHRPSIWSRQARDRTRRYTHLLPFLFSRLLIHSMCAGDSINQGDLVVEIVH